jgi:chitin disaccharide deacetylase
MLATLPPGVTHVALHCTAPGEFAAIAPDHAIWRQAEYDLVASGAIAELCAAADVSIIGTRDLQQLWISSG